MRYEQAGGKGKKPKPLQRPKKAKKEEAKKHKRLNVSTERRQELLFGARDKTKQQ